MDDVFQATFLLLATRAATIRNPEALGSWLHGVAHRLAVRSKTRAARRVESERKAFAAAAAPDGGDDLDLPTIRRLIHAEVDRLPETFRRPILLCYLEGRTNEEAARILGCPSGTLKTRLARGREILKGRLARRGIALSAALLLLLIPGAAEAEPVPPWLVASTVEAAIRRAGPARRAALAPRRVRISRLVRASACVTALVTIAIASVLLGPSPARGTWLRWFADLFHKYCR